MLINTDITIAYKCFSCGTFNFKNVNLFKLFPREKITFGCSCKNSKMEIIRTGKSDYRLTVPCIGCGTEHSQNISREMLLNNNILTYTCPLTSIKYCFIGKDKAVREFIDNFEKELDGMIDGLGFDSYFENTRVMLDTLNRIHDIAERGRLCCECGCEDIIVSMHRKGIILKCSQCTGGKFIPAATNNDLKKTLLRDKIILFGKKPKYNYQSKV